jgi:4'-phosphopantetheinyl transferase
MTTATISEEALNLHVRRFSGYKGSLPIPGRNHIEVWHTLTDPPVFADLPDCLAVEEVERASRFKVQKARDEFVAGRHLVRTLLGSYLAIQPKLIRFSYEGNGKPCLDSCHHSCLNFNVSHSDGLVIAAFCRDLVIGIDVEKIRTDFEIDEISERFFSVAERHDLHAVPAAERYEAFFRCWTRKEAYIKALGEGLSHPLHRFDVSITKDDASLLSTRPDATEASRWSLHAVPVPEDYVAALAVKRYQAQTSLPESGPSARNLRVHEK